jgi:hypothetical protein
MVNANVRSGFFIARELGRRMSRQHQRCMLFITRYAETRATSRTAPPPRPGRPWW